MTRELTNLSITELEEMIRSEDPSQIQRATDELHHRSSRRARALLYLGRERLWALRGARPARPVIVLPAEWSDRSFEEVSDSARLLNLLLRLRVHTLAELASASWPALADLPGMGRKSFAHLITAVANATAGIDVGSKAGHGSTLLELPISEEAIGVLAAWKLEDIDVIAAQCRPLSAADARRGLLITDALMEGRVEWTSLTRGPEAPTPNSGDNESSTTLAWAWPRKLHHDSDSVDTAALVQFIRTLNRWRALEGSPPTLGEAIDGRRESLPSDLQVLAKTCDESGVLALQDRSIPAPREEFDRWYTSLEHRDQQILLRRVLALHEPHNLAEIGEDFGVSRERIRQLAQRLQDRLLQAIGTEPGWRATRWRIHRLKREGWQFIRLSDLRVPDLNPSATPDPRPLDLAFLGFLALVTGMESHQTADWIEKEAGQVAEAADRFNEWMEEVSWCPLEEANQHVMRLGCHPRSADEWLRHFTPTKRQDGGLLYWPNGYEGRITAILKWKGEALSPDEIVDIYGPETSDASIRAALSRYDGFIKVSRTAWGLADWGDRAFEGIAPAIRSKIEARGGTACVAELAAEIAEEYDVRSHSVAMIAHAPCFKVVDGHVMLRSADDPYRPKDDLKTSRGLFLTRPLQASLLVSTTLEMLRGSGTPIPEALGAHLGILPGMRKGFHCEDHKVTVSWPDTSTSGPTLGSIRVCLEALQIEAGELIRVDFDAEDLDMRIERLDLNSLAASPDAVLRAATGLGGEGERLYTAVAHSLSARRDEARGILVRRGDERLASHIPSAADSPRLHEALDEFGEALSGSR